MYVSAPDALTSPTSIYTRGIRTLFHLYDRLLREITTANTDRADWYRNSIATFLSVRSISIGSLKFVFNLATPNVCYYRINDIFKVRIIFVIQRNSINFSRINFQSVFSLDSKKEMH